MTIEKAQYSAAPTGAASALSAGLGADRRWDKVVCSEYRCNWHGPEDEILLAPSPFKEGETLYACPKCKGIGTVVFACDEPGCWKKAACGTPTPTTYRRTCGRHAPNA